MGEGFSCLSFVPVKYQNEDSTLNSPKSFSYNEEYASEMEETVEMEFILAGQSLPTPTVHSFWKQCLLEFR